MTSASSAANTTTTATSSCCALTSIHEAAVSTNKKIAGYGDGAQDGVFLPMVFVSKLSSILLNEYDSGNKWAGFLGKLGEKVNEARFCLRFFSTFRALNALVTKSYEKGAKDSTTKNVKLLQTISGLLFGPLELLAYAKMIAPKSFDYDGGVFGRGSCMCWLADLVLSYYHIYQNYKALQTTDSRIPIIHQFIATTCDVFLAANWSLKKGFLTEKQIAILGSVSGVLRFWMTWVKN
eukprot:TRINITY_DN10439_c0_g1_i1.p1 TRINITY_DN10439_c0_g1~~TRINITY_DN10439_c0_g1_i1.p1  ORF type:complete len:236 (-),score=41.91 TRINITY_DN10439_c0_g1_i1:287-994(-)